MQVVSRTASTCASRQSVCQAKPLRSVVVRAEAAPATAPAAAPAAPKAAKAPWVQPTLDDSLPSPIFGGSTGGLLRKAQVEEFYVMTWDAKKEQIFEMPTGGAAIMRKGPNLLKFARKEQCMALTLQLRTKFKLEPCFYRVFPDGKVEYLHPNDGVYPERVNAGRKGVNQNFRSIGENVNPIKVSRDTGNLAFDTISFVLTTCFAWLSPTRSSSPARTCLRSKDKSSLYMLNYFTAMESGATDQQATTIDSEQEVGCAMTQLPLFIVRA
ncbi:hypothetical protein QJQ45_019437 [Haematococcus lacustris]|nr:hypothetical protein QJQ45_019437 [Haematococcus lacustris]